MLYVKHETTGKTLWEDIADWETENKAEDFITMMGFKSVRKVTDGNTVIYWVK